MHWNKFTWLCLTWIFGAAFLTACALERSTQPAPLALNTQTETSPAPTDPDSTASFQPATPEVMDPTVTETVSPYTAALQAQAATRTAQALILSPTPSPTHPPEWPARRGSQAPTASEPISAANLDRLERAAVWNMGPMRSLAYSPDGKILAVGTLSGVILYAPSSLMEVGYLRARLPEILQLNFSQDGQRLAAVEGFQGGQIQIEVYDVPGRKLLKTYPPGFNSFAPGDAASFPAARQFPPRLETWDEQAGLRASIQGDTISVTSSSGEVKASLTAYDCTNLALSQDGGLIVALCSDGVRAWDVAGQKLLTVLSGTHFFLSADGQTLVVFKKASRSSDNLNAELWRLDADRTAFEGLGQIDGEFLLDDGFTPAGGFMPDGKRLMLFQTVEGDQNTNARVDWLILNPQNGSILQTQTIYTSPGWSVGRFHLQTMLAAPDGTSASVLYKDYPGGGDNATTLVTASLAGARAVFKTITSGAGGLSAIGYMPDGNLAVVDGALQILDSASGKVLTQKEAAPNVWGMKFSPISSLISFAANPNLTINLNDTYLPFRKALAAFSPDGQWVAWGLMPEVMLAANTPPYDPVITFKDMGFRMNDLEFSPDSSRFVVSVQMREPDNFSTLSIYAADSGTEQLRFFAQGYASNFHFTPDSQYLVGLDSDCTHGAEAGGMCIPMLRIWQAQDGQVVGDLPANAVWRYDLSPDGKLAALIPGNEHLLFYSIPEGALLADYSLGVSGISTLAFSADGSHLAVGLAEGTIEIFAVRPAEAP